MNKTIIVGNITHNNREATVHSISTVLQSSTQEEHKVLTESFTNSLTLEDYKGSITIDKDVLKALIWGVEVYDGF